VDRLLVDRLLVDRLLVDRLLADRRFHNLFPFHLSADVDLQVLLSAWRRRRRHLQVMFEALVLPRPSRSPILCASLALYSEDVLWDPRTRIPVLCLI
jgi:hypothetical protein